MIPGITKRVKRGSTRVQALVEDGGDEVLHRRRVGAAPAVCEIGAWRFRRRSASYVTSPCLSAENEGMT